MEFTLSRSIEKDIMLKNHLDILIVDDNLVTTESLKELIELRGHKVETVDEGPRCLTMCENDHYDIIFMDYHMEGLDGDKIVELVQMSEVKSHIFAFTGDKSKECIEKFRKLKVDGIIFKPVDPDLLLSMFNQFEKQTLSDENVMKQLERRSRGEIMFFY